LKSPTGANPEDLSEEAESQQSEYEGEAEPRTPQREWHSPSNSNDFRG